MDLNIKQNTNSRNYNTSHLIDKRHSWNLEFWNRESSIENYKGSDREIDS